MLKFSSNIFGLSFDQNTIEAVWQKGQIVPGYDSSKYRKDQCGVWMTRSEYGNTGSVYGWEIDHIKPKSQRGSDSLFNLQPLQWENNRHKSDNWPQWYCKLKAA
ncbi:MAG: HNH endonuclease [Bacteroidetes bacterium]|nr:HNH endonuclease [Bacteroidota bacterium]